MAYASSYEPEARTLHCSGDVEGPALAAFRGAMATHCYEAGTDLVVDLTEVTYLPSTAIGLMAVALKTADVTGCVLEFVTAAGSLVDRTLEISSMPHRVAGQRQ